MWEDEIKNINCGNIDKHHLQFSEESANLKNVTENRVGWHNSLI